MSICRGSTVESTIVAMTNLSLAISVPEDRSQVQVCNEGHEKVHPTDSQKLPQPGQLSQLC